MNKQSYRFPKTDVGEKLITEFEKIEVVKLNCQDWEYTSPRLEKLETYLERYKQFSTTGDEKRVLAAFIFQVSEDSLSENYTENEDLVRENLSILFEDFEITKYEFYYWSCWETDDKVDRFYVAEIAREFNVKINDDCCL
jgi:hypothetical protein